MVPSFLSFSLRHERILTRRAHNVHGLGKANSFVGAAEDALPFQFFPLRGREARVFRQDLFVMFAQKRRFEVESLGEFREAQREARYLEIAQHAIMHGAHAAALPEMRMLE